MVCQENLLSGLNKPSAHWLCILQVFSYLSYVIRIHVYIHEWADEQIQKQTSKERKNKHHEWIDTWSANTSNIYMSMCVYIYICIHMYICIYIYICIDIYAHRTTHPLWISGSWFGRRCAAAATAFVSRRPGQGATAMWWCGPAWCPPSIKAMAIQLGSQT